MFYSHNHNSDQSRFSCDEISIAERSSRNVFITESLIVLVVFLSLCSLPWYSQIDKTRQLIKYVAKWYWGQNVHVFLWWVSQNIWSMRLNVWLANPARKVVLKKRLFAHIQSNWSRSEICDKFVSKSPSNVAYVFSLWSTFVIEEISQELWHTITRGR